MRALNSLKISCGLFLFVFSVSSYAGDTLNMNEALSNNGFIQSADGKYKLIMQGDGNLVMYRADWSVRWSPMTNRGSFAVMQSDGNFVVYASGNVPLWHTGTYGGIFGNYYLTIHDDGDLSITAKNGQIILGVWSLGRDPKYSANPTLVGDVVGRDLAFFGAGYLGHLGIWDGGQVFNVGPPTTGTNAVHINSMYDFRNTITNVGTVASYWGTASYNIPPGSIGMYGCWDTICPIYNGTVSAEARYSVALNLMRIYRVGADYTAYAIYTRALMQYNGYPLQRGKYRCDTFVIDAIRPSTYFYPTKNKEQTTWANRWSDLNGGLVTPSSIFNKLKTYK